MQKSNDQNYYTRRAGETRAQAERCEDTHAKAIYLELAGRYEQAATSTNAIQPAE